MWIYFQVVLRRWYVWVLTTIIAVIVAAVGFAQSPDVYTARTKLLILPYVTDRPDYATFEYFERLARTYTEILSSTVTRAEAKDRLGVEELPGYRAYTISDTSLLEISVTDEDPLLAQEAANMLATILVERGQSQYLSNLDVLGENLGAQVAQYEAEIDELIREEARLLDEIPRDDIRIAEVGRTLGARQETYNRLLSSYNQALIAEVFQASLITIFEPAFLPDEPAGPGSLLVLVGGAGLGFLGGVGLAFVLETIYPRLYSARQIEEALNAEIIGKIPRIPRKHQSNVFGNDVVVAEAFRRLRTNILACYPEQARHRSLMVTSAQPDDGKSVVAVNLAIALASTFERVCLIDADIRRASIHRLLGIVNDAGLCDVLAGDVRHEDAVKRTARLPGLHVLSAGHCHNSVEEPLNPLRLRGLMETLNETYDFVVIDSAPILAVTDASIVAPLVDGYIMMVPHNADMRPMTQARESISMVSANLFGVVINRAPRDRTASWTRRYRS